MEPEMVLISGKGAWAFLGHALQENLVAILRVCQHEIVAEC